MVFALFVLLFRMLNESSAALADSYFRDGAPVMAACCHLAVSNVKVGHNISFILRSYKSVQ